MLSFDALRRFDPLGRPAPVTGRLPQLEFERDRLRRGGRDDLADGVRWVSDLDGDGFGYDVKSFEPDGQERQLETQDHLRPRTHRVLAHPAKSTLLPRTAAPTGSGGCSTSAIEPRCSRFARRWRRGS